MDDEELLAQAAAARQEVEEAFVRRRRRMTDFRYDESQTAYWDTTTGLLLAAKSVDGAIPREFWPTRQDRRNGRQIPYEPSIAINDVDTGLTVEGATWWPGEDVFIQNTVITNRGAMRKKGAQTYNTYVEPDRDNLRDDQMPDKWIEHVKKIFPEPVEHEHFFDFAAHMVQRADEKVNHGIVMAGVQGIGKDTALLPLRRAVGEWNTAEIEPDAVSDKYNAYVKSVMLVINEVRPHDEDHKASNFYNQLKPLLASPPEMLPMEMKYQNVIYVRNLCHVVLTTNDPLTMYIPPEDRRLFVMNSPLPDPRKNPVFPPGYFEDIYKYLHDGGIDAVIRWLLNRNILTFNAGDPPPVTAGKLAIIGSANEVRRTAIDTVFELYAQCVGGEKRPSVVFVADLLGFVNSGPFFDDRDAMVKAITAKNLHFKMDERGYAMVKNPDGTEWRNGKFRSRAAFVDKSLPPSEQLEAIAKELSRRPLEFRPPEF